MKKILLSLVFLFIASQQYQAQMTIYEAYPYNQSFYKGGTKAFYKELRQVILDKALPACENRSEHYDIPILVKEDATINFVKEENEAGIAENKCAYEMIRKALPYLNHWTPATVDGKKVNTITEIEFYPDDLFTNYSESYSSPDDNLIKPEFPGGMDKFRQKVMQYVEVKHLEMSEKIIMIFTIDKEGNLVEPSIAGYQDSGLGKSALVGLKQIKTKWKPATKNGVPMSYRFRIPISTEIGVNKYEDEQFK
jgi:hypothetical protein